jgi:hypothetical protein
MNIHIQNEQNQKPNKMMILCFLTGLKPMNNLAYFDLIVQLSKDIQNGSSECITLQKRAKDRLFHRL